MGEESEHLKEHIYETRTELGHNLDELEAKVKRTFNWRSQFEDHTAVAIGIALGAGILLSMITPLPSNRPLRRASAEFPDSDLGEALNENTRILKETWSRIKGALIGVAAMRATSFIDDLLPGFEKAYQKLEYEGDETREPHFR